MSCTALLTVLCLFYRNVYYVVMTSHPHNLPQTGFPKTAEELCRTPTGTLAAASPLARRSWPPRAPRSSGCGSRARSCTRRPPLLAPCRGVCSLAQNNVLASKTASAPSCCLTWHPVDFVAQDLPCCPVNPREAVLHLLRHVTVPAQHHRTCNFLQRYMCALQMLWLVEQMKHNNTTYSRPGSRNI